MSPRSMTLVYFSPTGTSAKVAYGIASGIPLPANEHNLSFPQTRTRKKHFSPEELVILAFPVYGGRLPKIVLDTLENISADKSPAILSVIYGNRHYDDALLELKNVSEERGFLPVAAGAFLGEHSYTRKVAFGRPDSNDIALAKDLGQGAFASLQQNPTPSSSLQVPGKFPYEKPTLDLHIPPSVNDNCIDCQICVEGCPTGAINPDNPRETEQSKCISCCYCVKVCPNDARHMTHERILASVNFLETHCTEPRAVESFLA